jgi:hypothetical protein
MSPSSVELKLRPFSSGVKDQVGVEDQSGPEVYHHIGSTDDMRLGQQQNSYHVSNTTNNKDW